MSGSNRTEVSVAEGRSSLLCRNNSQHFPTLDRGMHARDTQQGHAKQNLPTKLLNLCRYSFTAATAMHNATALCTFNPIPLSLVTANHHISLARLLLKTYKRTLSHSAFCCTSQKHRASPTPHLQEGGLAAAVLSNEAVAAADGQLNAAVLNKLIAADAQGEAVNLDVTCSRA